MNRIEVNLTTGEQNIIPFTEEEMAEYTLKKAEADAAEAVKAQLQEAHSAAAAVFDTMPRWKRAFWNPIREEVSKAILEGDIAGAVEILTDIPAFYEGAEADRQMFLALFA